MGSMVGRAIKLMVRLALFSFAVVAVIVWLLFFSERPENQIDPFTLAGDGSARLLRTAPARWQRQIGCGYSEGQYARMLLQALSATHFERMHRTASDDADDIRGLWLGVEGGHTGHVERIEQCGERVVVTTSRRHS